jgi:hypothetical protein
MKTDLLSAKANNAEEQSDAVVVSFAAEWHKLIESKSFSAVIRKRIPRTIEPKWLYFHVNSPIGAICARAQIESCKEILIDEACAISISINLSPQHIRDYAEEHQKIGCYRLVKIFNAAQPVIQSQLSGHMKYHAPQSFFILSKAAKSIIDQLAGFEI